MRKRMRVVWVAVLLGACAPDAGTEDGVGADTTAVDTAGAQDTAAAAVDGAMLDPDRASHDELAALPGMTQDLAHAVMTRRPFDNMLQVDSLLGSLSEEQRDTIYTRLWKPLDLNSASAQEIELIPGVGERMRHEFEEYRPYTDMGQFRREIGKYVDDAEVERLARYVTIR